MMTMMMMMVMMMMVMVMVMMMMVMIMQWETAAAAAAAAAEAVAMAKLLMLDFLSRARVSFFFESMRPSMYEWNPVVMGQSKHLRDPRRRHRTRHAMVSAHETAFRQ